MATRKFKLHIWLAFVAHVIFLLDSTGLMGAELKHIDLAFISVCLRDSWSLLLGLQTGWGAGQVYQHGTKSHCDKCLSCPCSRVLRRNLGRLHRRGDFSVRHYKMNRSSQAG